DRVEFGAFAPALVGDSNADTSWRKALRRAAEVMNGMTDEARPSAVIARQPAVKRKSAPKARAAARTLTSTPKPKTKTKSAAAKKKSTSKTGTKKASVKKKSAKMKSTQPI